MNTTILRRSFNAKSVIRKLEALTGADRLSASAIKDLPGGGDKLVNLVDGATVTIPVQHLAMFRVTIAGNRTIAFSGDADGDRWMFDITQDGTGSRTVTWPAGILWSGGSAPTLTTTAGKTDTVGFFRRSSGVYQGYLVGPNI